MHFDFPDRAVSTKLQMLAGALPVVQGFETLRSLGDRYSREVRVASMRNAQALSGALYIVSVILLMPMVQGMDLVEVELSAIVDAMHPVALVLPSMLMVATLASQFSAAVAARLAREQPWPADGPGRLRHARRVRGPSGVGHRPAPQDAKTKASAR